MKLVNSSKRARMIPTEVEFTRLDAGGAINITAAELDYLKRKQRFRDWLHAGVVKVEDGDAAPTPPPADERPEEVPEGATGEGTEIIHHGGGWYSVLHDGMPCTDEKVRKDRADEIAADYA